MSLGFSHLQLTCTGKSKGPAAGIPVPGEKSHCTGWSCILQCVLDGVRQLRSHKYPATPSQHLPSHSKIQPGNKIPVGRAHLQASLAAHLQTHMWIIQTCPEWVSQSQQQLWPHAHLLQGPSLSRRDLTLLRLSTWELLCQITW